MQDMAISRSKLDHVGLSVSNLDTAMTFYRDVLGFGLVEETFEIASHDVKGAVILNEAGTRIELFLSANSRSMRKGHPIEDIALRGWFQIAFGVPDAHAAFQDAVAAGARPVLTPRIAPDGVSTVAFIADPDDNLIEFLQRGAK